ncbi:MAG: hypothetical protein V4685_10500 [Bacteroidota bacterium]
MKAINTLEKKQFLRIVDKQEFNSPALPGKPLNLKEFKDWIAGAETSATVSLKEAKAKWVGKRKQLQKLTR